MRPLVLARSNGSWSSHRPCHSWSSSQGELPQPYPDPFPTAVVSKEQCCCLMHPFIMRSYHECFIQHVQINSGWHVTSSVAACRSHSGPWSLRVLRSSQLDAQRLDAELQTMLHEQFMAVFQLLPQVGTIRDHICRSAAAAVGG